MYVFGIPAMPHIVALFTRAWIEINLLTLLYLFIIVALFTRAWIEIKPGKPPNPVYPGRPLHEGVD